MATAAPSARSAAAVPRPMPRLPPITSARFPCRPRSILPIRFVTMIRGSCLRSRVLGKCRAIAGSERESGGDGETARSREFDRDCRTGSGLAGDTQIAPMQLHQPAHNRQAEAGPGLAGDMGVARPTGLVEHFGEVLWRNADSG